ncbi:arsenate-mycothiol transferase ArsC [Corynebacterium epidermidicanis]|uniref:Protein-tyrosine-phosphatase n=1 Tax=Corynebacterium epidermidicanis TaxID=1050174 RepID=A0A0G3GXC8_9CORY|nr:hypothetical protein [Corynebacterium epidermidicanis]AKK04163.1 protein-tyrosine-phosphatase [Corynebacterium epidermidicanis]
MSAREFEIIREDLHRRYGQAVEESLINSVLDSEIAEQTATAKVQAFLPVMVEREVSEKLEQLAEEAGFSKGARKEILFVDAHNGCRTQLAAAIARHYSHDGVFVRSVGLEPQGGINPAVYEVLGERGIRSDFLYQKEITPRVSHRADLVVLLGVDEIPGVPGDRYLKWDISVSKTPGVEEIRGIADTLEANIKDLLIELDAYEAPAKVHA